MPTIFEIKKLTQEEKSKNMDLILAACNGDLSKLETLFSNMSHDNQQLNKSINDNIIQCVLEWSKRPNDVKMQVISFLITKGVEYRQYFINKDVDLDIMQKLIACGANVNVDYQGYTPLHAAVVSTKEKEAIKLLLENGANMNVLENIYGFGTPLHVLIANESFETAIDLIELSKKYKTKIDYSLRDREGKTPLIIAVKVMSLSLVKKIILEDKKCINITDNEERTALHFACVLGRTHIAEELIRNGADINRRDKQGNTPAHYAVFNSLLIKAVLTSIYIDPDRDVGATKNAIFDRNNKAIPMPVDFLRLNKLKTTPLISDSTNKETHGEMLCSVENKAFFIKSLKFTEHLADKECIQQQINSIKGESITQACLKGHQSVVTLLIDYGTDVTLPNKKGQLPSTLNTDKAINSLLRKAEQKIWGVRPKPLGDRDGEPTTDFRFYDPEFAKVALGVKKQM